MTRVVAEPHKEEGHAVKTEAETRGVLPKFQEPGIAGDRKLEGAWKNEA